MTKRHEVHIRKLTKEATPGSLPDTLFEAPHFVLLESSLGGRYSIAAWEPRDVLTAEANDGAFLENFAKSLRSSPAINAPELPFAGGWIGYLAYELYDEILPKVPSRPTSLMPKAVMAYYDRFFLFDHERRETLAVSVAPEGGPPEWPRTLFEPHSVQRGESRPVLGRVPQAMEAAPLPGRDAYLRSIDVIKRLIDAGDCYQVNLSQKFETDISQPSAVIYRHLRERSPAPYASFLNLGNAQILSSSPELFLEIDGRRVVTRPIKGTRPRGTDPAQDARLKEDLSSSEKDRAELLMITDLERNDLGRVCRPGSVRVSELRKVESFPQVHHLVSTIEGELQDGRGVVDVLRATFPGGSITGAPKIRAMQIIRELEPHAREVYCGAIGFVSLNGKAQFNVAIRTMVVKDGSAHYWSGAGIVADSDPEAEYEEILAKAAGMKLGLNL